VIAIILSFAGCGDSGGSDDYLPSYTPQASLTPPPGGWNWPDGSDSGTATITVSGALSGAFTLSGRRGHPRFAAGAVDARTVAAFDWEDGTHSVSLIALPFSGTGTGTRTTSPDPALELHFVFNGTTKPIDLASGHGECEVTIAEVDVSHIAGSFRCGRLTDVDLREYSIQGSFVAYDDNT
jgi:hypothetical protein